MTTSLMSLFKSDGQGSSGSRRLMVTRMDSGLMAMDLEHNVSETSKCALPNSNLHLLQLHYCPFIEYVLV